MTKPPATSSLESAFPTFYSIARRMKSGGTYVTVINDSPSPHPLKEVARQFVRQAHLGNRSSKKLARMILGHFDQQLAHGVTAEAVAEQWRDVIPVPAVVKMNDPSLLTVHSLPRPIVDLVVRVVRRTRLWRREQIDVANELISHFQEGIDAGLPESKLLEGFGDPTAAARLIRRAKIRNRPLSWKVLRRSFQAFGTVLLLFFIWWAWLWVRFHFAKPNVTYDYIGNRDALSKAIPESDRAWPLYAQAITKCSECNCAYSFPSPPGADGKLLPEWVGLADLVDIQRVNGRVQGTWNVSAEGVGAPQGTENVHREYRMKMDVYTKALDELSQGSHWPAMVQFAEMNREAIELALQAATKPELGFIYRDPANEVWLNVVNQGQPSRFEEATNSLLAGVLLPQTQVIYSFVRLLKIECERSWLAGDRERVLRILAASLHIGEQVGSSDTFLVEKCLAINYSTPCWTFVRNILAEQPDFFSDSDLRDLAHRIAASRVQLEVALTSDSKQIYDDLLQRLYTDNGNGDGYLTSTASRLLDEQVKMYPGTEVKLNPWERSSSPLAPLMAGLTVSRSELKQVLDHFVELDNLELREPLWNTDLDRTPRSIEYLLGLVSPPLERIKYKMLQKFYPFSSLMRSGQSYFTPSAFVLAVESAKMRADSALVAIALEVYHRRHGTWPSRLEDLCPNLLPAVPLDRFDGKAMKYKLVDGQPFVYSVGRNRVDDGGTWASTDDGFESTTGDWRLWPVAIPK